jgi:hypothetical protein
MASPGKAEAEHGGTPLGASTVKVLSKRESIDIQRVNRHEPGYGSISGYLGKQSDMEWMALDPFNSDFSLSNKREDIDSPSPTQKVMLSSLTRHCSCEEWIFRPPCSSGKFPEENSS